MPAEFDLEQLTQDLASIEELTTQQLISRVKIILVAAGTGHPIQDINEIYQKFYQELAVRLKRESLDNPNMFSDLWEFHQYWKENELTTYASRRAFIAGLYSGATQSKQFDVWSLIHPDIVAIAKSRFDSKHYADAVEACMKEINSRVKAIVRQQTGKDLDGSELMTYAFSAKNPLLTLDDITTEDGKSIQVGYMQLFSGSMTGIRNPKAHGNIVLKPEEAIPLIFIAHTLLVKLEMSKINPNHPDKNYDSGLFITVSDLEPKMLDALKAIVTSTSGECQTFLNITSSTPKLIRLQTKVNPTPTLIERLKGIPGVKDAYLS